MRTESEVQVWLGFGGVLFGSVKVATVPLTVAEPSAAVNVNPPVATTFGSVMVAVSVTTCGVVASWLMVTLIVAGPSLSALIESAEHTSVLQSHLNLVCRLLL